MTDSTQPQPQPQRKQWSSPTERVVIQSLWIVILLTIIVATTVLAFRGVLDKFTVGTIFGTIVGHAGTSAAAKMSSRSTDHAGS